MKQAVLPAVGVLILLVQLRSVPVVDVPKVAASGHRRAVTGRTPCLRGAKPLGRAQQPPPVNLDDEDHIHRGEN